MGLQTAKTDPPVVPCSFVDAVWQGLASQAFIHECRGDLNASSWLKSRQTHWKTRLYSPADTYGSSAILGLASGLSLLLPECEPTCLPRSLQPSLFRSLGPEASEVTRNPELSCHLSASVESRGWCAWA